MCVPGVNIPAKRARATCSYRHNGRAQQQLKIRTHTTAQYYVHVAHKVRRVFYRLTAHYDAFGGRTHEGKFSFIFTYCLLHFYRLSANGYTSNFAFPCLHRCISVQAGYGCDPIRRSCFSVPPVRRFLHPVTFYVALPARRPFGAETDVAKTFAYLKRKKTD